jgi:hypothetical protein
MHPQRAAERRYQQSARGRYIRHKVNAKRRGVEFLLTFEQWLKVWLDSGHWCDTRNGGFHMCRHGDVGPYALGNVYIGSKGTNCAERNRSVAIRRRARS